MPNAKKPTALKRLEGTWRADRHNPNEPELPAEFPDRPPWVDDDPRTAALFEQIGQYLVEMRIATRVDSIGVSLLADQLNLYLEMREQVREEGNTIIVQGGSSTYTKAHPLMTPMNQTYQNIVRLLKEYGLTPVARTNVEASENEGDSFDQFLNGT